jgi:hypothetical protein
MEIKSSLFQTGRYLTSKKKVRMKIQILLLLLHLPRTSMERKINSTLGSIDGEKYLFK